MPAAPRRETYSRGSEHYLSLEGTHEILRELRKVWDEFDAFTVGETVFVTPKEAQDLCGLDRHELDMVFSFEHMECDQVFIKWFKTNFKPQKLFACLTKWQKSLPWNALYLENHDQPRSVSRFGSKAHPLESGKLLATLLLTLRGYGLGAGFGGLGAAGGYPCRQGAGKKRYPRQKCIRTAVGGSDIERGGGVSDPVGHSAIWHRKRERGVIVEGPEASDLL